MTTIPAPLPTTLADWQAGRADQRAMLWRVLGDLPPHPDSQRVFYMPLDAANPAATPTDCAAPADCPQN